ncbi:hypothetical protein F441_01133 [Phytophthora nicotianae CJ01A1]|uniref:Uncharacterized protein n=3 Tax=Phytophthora nicotianae TaxID=4792 RepID=W2XTC0_PHYNI|nr:hypothetical protein F441_01133 [Phytophthora nicotianae CJ01A1]
MAVAKNCPLMTGLVWWDRKPVQFLGQDQVGRWKLAGDEHEAQEGNATSSRAHPWCVTITVDGRGRHTRSASTSAVFPPAANMVQEILQGNFHGAG